MKFRCISISKLREFVPPWLCDYMQLGRHVDELLSRHQLDHPFDAYRALNFWVEVNLDSGYFRIALPSSPDEEHVCGTLFVLSKGRRVIVPLNDVLIGCEPAHGPYCLYFHTLMLDVPLGYIGITKRNWFVRLAEHETAARAGSRFLFHTALRQHQGVERQHRVWFAGLSAQEAMAYEEEYVGGYSLYPRGLNMIPGGMAGLRYLSSLSVKLTDTEHVAERLAEEMDRPERNGVPNPLCAARWESDPDYAARVICGHSGRLTVDQVREIRALKITGRPASDIAALAGTQNLPQVMRVLSEKTYRRVR